MTDQFSAHDMATAASEGFRAGQGSIQTVADGRWYMVTQDGAATLCVDRADAEAEARKADREWPRNGPHRAVRLVEASFEAADIATAAADGFRDGASIAATWIASKDQMPPPGVRVFCGDVDSDRVGYDCWAGDDFIWTPSHWMHIPEFHAIQHQPIGRVIGSAEVAKLRGQRMVLCSLLGECLPVIDALMQIPSDDASDARLNGLAGRIMAAQEVIAEDQVKGGEL